MFCQVYNCHSEFFRALAGTYHPFWRLNDAESVEVAGLFRQIFEDWANQLKHYDFANAAVVLAGTKAAREFFEPVFSERDQELTLVGFCDDRLRLVQLLFFPGSRDKSVVSVREIARHAMACAGFIVAHNHPSGNSRPSESDINLTRRLCVLAEALDVQFLDHLVFADGGMSSFRQMGLM